MYPYPVKFTDRINIQEFLHDLVLGLPYTVIFPYPSKAPICSAIWLISKRSTRIDVDKVVTEDN